MPRHPRRPSLAMLLAAACDNLPAVILDDGPAVPTLPERAPDPVAALPVRVRCEACGGVHAYASADAPRRCLRDAA